MLARLLAHVKQVFASPVNDLGIAENQMLLPGERHMDIVILSVFLLAYNNLPLSLFK